MLEGIGGVLGQNEVFIDSYSLSAKYLGALYGIEKGFSVFRFSIFLGIWNHTLFLAPDQFLGPIFGQVVAFEEFSKRYLGILAILRFLAHNFTHFLHLDGAKNGWKSQHLKNFPQSLNDS